MAKAELKTYYVPSEGLDVSYGDVVGTEVQNKARGVISFNRGRYQTDDPEKQAFLDSYGGCISEDQWKKTHIDPSVLKEIERKENERLQQERNSLLAEVQKLKEEVAKKGK